jgi:hypothetical protein
MKLFECLFIHCSKIARRQKLHHAGALERPAEVTDLLIAALS